jgi:endo-1,4-beta-xylanase
LDKALETVVLRDCTDLVPEIDLNWTSIEWHKGEYHFEPVDGLVTFAQANGMRVHGHTLLWEQSTPDWAKQEVAEQQSWDIVAGHFARVLGRYSDRIDNWNVVNEAIDTEGGESDIRRNTFQRAFGSDYVERALREAHAIAPRARLLINDYGFEYDNPTDAARRSAFLNLVRRLKERDVPLDGVGLQAHLDLSKGALAEDPLRSFMRDLADSGVDITITELDVREQVGNQTVAERDDRVAAETRRFLDIALEVPAVRGVITWGISDKHSWLSENLTQAQTTDDGRRFLNRGLPYDPQCKPKGMYWTISDSFKRFTNPEIALG